MIVSAHKVQIFGGGHVCLHIGLISLYDIEFPTQICQCRLFRRWGVPIPRTFYKRYMGAFIMPPMSPQINLCVDVNETSPTHPQDEEVELVLFLTAVAFASKTPTGRLYQILKESLQGTDDPLRLLFTASFYLW
jgi:hypothetical protein